ncbi:hypothetical protein HKCCE4037_18305 [Rhodobacterales bacterium HKCCE4037]|nr:hypothetical protein [Rhodobacterales bacterium HKCCE4037]
MRSLILSLIAVAVLACGAAAQTQPTQYVAYIGPEDLYNSNGARLSAPWQVLRQDRANYHRFGIRHAGDEWDPLFHDMNNRAAMERMIQQGYISPVAAQDIMRGGATVVVRIYSGFGANDRIEVDVWR